MNKDLSYEEVLEQELKDVRDTNNTMKNKIIKIDNVDEMVLLSDAMGRNTGTIIGLAGTLIQLGRRTKELN